MFGWVRQWNPLSTPTGSWTFRRSERMYDSYLSNPCSGPSVGSICREYTGPLSAESPGLDLAKCSPIGSKKYAGSVGLNVRNSFSNNGAERTRKQPDDNIVEELGIHSRHRQQGNAPRSAATYCGCPFARSWRKICACCAQVIACVGEPTARNNGPRDLVHVSSLNDVSVARMEGSAIGVPFAAARTPDFATLHPGYAIRPRRRPGPPGRYSPRTF